MMVCFFIRGMYDLPDVAKAAAGTGWLYVSGEAGAWLVQLLVNLLEGSLGKMDALPTEALELRMKF